MGFLGEILMRRAVGCPVGVHICIFLSEGRSDGVYQSHVTEAIRLLRTQRWYSRVRQEYRQICLSLSFMCDRPCWGYNRWGITVRFCGDSQWVQSTSYMSELHAGECMFTIKKPPQQLAGHISILTSINNQLVLPHTGPHTT